MAIIDPTSALPATGYRLTDRYTRDEGTVFSTGVQALARLPIEQLRADRRMGLNTAAFISGYQGSPLGGLDMEIARAIRGVDVPITLRPAVNEEFGATAVMGSQLAAAQPDCRYDGVLGLWYGKAPGLDRACDALRHAVFAGTSAHGGAVAIVGDDPAAKSSTLPSSSDATLLDLHMPILYPGDVAEVLELGRHAIALSRVSGMWTSLKIVASVADGSGTVELSTHAFESRLPAGMEPNRRLPDGMLMTPHTLELEREFREVRTPLAIAYAEANDLNRITIDAPDAWIGLVASGYTYHEMLEALRRIGLDTPERIAAAGIRVLQMRMPVPFGPEVVRRFARGLHEIVVVEEKNPTLEWLIKDALYGTADMPTVVGKADQRGETLFRTWGQMDADAIVGGLRRRLTPRIADRLIPEAPKPPERALIPVNVNRTPAYCSGCPHNWGTQAPEGALVGAGIGCHIMAVFMEPERVGDLAGITAMGNEGTQWLGMAPFLERDHFIQNLGDGTFFHSGQLAVQAAVAADAHITFKLLVNDAVAMTGGQDPQGGVPVPDIAEILVRHGVNRIIITTEDRTRYREVPLARGSHGPTEVWDRTRIIEAQEELAATPGVTVLIHDQACAAETRRKRKRGLVGTPRFRVVINPRVCEACGDCGVKSNCLSLHTVDTPYGPKTAIDQTSCNLDASCLEGDCPSFALVAVDPDAPAASAPRGEVDTGNLPEPPMPLMRGEYNVRMAGIGGTGVVTAAQVLGTAAMLSGLEARGNDQTGLSQKAGPVISDLRLSPGGAPVSNLLGEGRADLVLAFDLLVGTDGKALAAAAPDRTVLVGSTSPTPTASMTGHPELTLPGTATLVDRASDHVRSEHTLLVDATALVTALVGDGATANTFLLGVAAQAGRLPVTVDALEDAIELNGVAVEVNRAAFRWGRRWAHDPEGTERAAGLGGHGAGFTSVGDLVDFLAEDLAGYANARYARRFRDRIGRIAAAEQRTLGEVGAITEAAARSLHRLMAYKDEYEVARLLLGPEGTEVATSVGGEDPQVTWMLHPPALAALGMRRKLKVRARMGRPMMRALRAGRRLRGTPLDPFGRAEVRKLERDLIPEFEAALDTLAERVGPDNHDWALRLASAPQQIRGYERLKVQRAATYREELAELLLAE